MKKLAFSFSHSRIKFQQLERTYWLESSRGQPEIHLINFLLRPSGSSEKKGKLEGNWRWKGTSLDWSNAILGHLLNSEVALLLLLPTYTHHNTNINVPIEDLDFWLRVIRWYLGAYGIKNLTVLKTLILVCWYRAVATGYFWPALIDQQFCKFNNLII